MSEDFAREHTQRRYASYMRSTERARRQARKFEHAIEDVMFWLGFIGAILTLVVWAISK